MTTAITQSELSPLAGFINDHYEGDLFAISRYLDNAVYMLRYVPDEAFTVDELQNVCFALNNIKECFYEAHRLRSVSGMLCTESFDPSQLSLLDETGSVGQ